MPLSKNISVFLSLNTKQFQSGITRATTRMKAFSASMTSMGASITRNFTMPFALLGGYAVKTSMDFEKALTKMRTLVGLTDAQVSAFKDNILELSGKTAQAPKDLAEGLYFLTSAGLEGENAFKALTQVSKGVSMELGEQTDLSKIAAAAQNAYGVATLEASKALDIFGKMVQTGMFESSELAKVLGKELGVAQSLGVSMEELGAMISTYTRTTGDATSATVGASAIMFAFEKATDRGSRALRRINMNYDDLRDMLGKQGLQKTLIHLKTEFDKQGMRMSDFFANVRAGKVALGILGEQTETYIDILDELEDSTGFVNEGFEVVAETGSFKMQKAFQSLKNSLIELGETLSPLVLQFSSVIEKLVSKWKNLNPETKTWITKMALAFAIGGPILMGVGKLASGIISAASAMGKFVLHNPKLALLAAAVALIAYYWDDVKIALANASNTFIDFYNNTIEFRALIWGVAGVLAQMVGLVVLIFDTMVATITYLGKKVESIISDTVGSLGDFLSGDVGVVDMAYKAFVTGNPFGAAADALGLGDALGMQAGGHPLLNPAGDDDPAITSEDFWDDEVNFAESALTAIDDFWKQSEHLWGQVKENVNEGKISAVVTPEMIQEPFDNVANNIKDALGSVFGDIAGWLGMDGEMDAFGGGLGEDEEGNLLDVVLSDEDIEEKKTKFQEFIDGVKTSWGEGMKIMAEEFDAFATRFGDGMADALSTAIVEGESMKEAFKGFMKQMTKEVLKMIIKTLVLRMVMQALGLPVAPMNLGLDSLGGVTDVGDVAFGPAKNRYIVGPEGAFSLSPRDSIVAGTNLFGGGSQGGDSMTVNGYISGSSIMLSNERETNTTNRLS